MAPFYYYHTGYVSLVTNVHDNYWQTILEICNKTITINQPIIVFLITFFVRSRYNFVHVHCYAV